MTKREAQMIAEEVYKMLEEQGQLPQPTYIGAKEAAKILGIKVSTLYAKRKLIPHTKSGKSLMFRQKDLINFIENGATTI